MEQVIELRRELSLFLFAISLWFLRSSSRRNVLQGFYFSSLLHVPGKPSIPHNLFHVYQGWIRIVTFAEGNTHTVQGSVFRLKPLPELCVLFLEMLWRLNHFLSLAALSAASFSALAWSAAAFSASATNSLRDLSTMPSHLSLP